MSSDQSLIFPKALLVAHLQNFGSTTQAQSLVRQNFGCIWSQLRTLMSGLWRTFGPALLYHVCEFLMMLVTILSSPYTDMTDKMTDVIITMNVQS
jgi:hypothetical protein